MKKTFIISVAAIAALMCSCSKQAPQINNDAQECEIVVCASFEDTKTAYVPEGRKVIWLKGDAIGARYIKVAGTGSYDNITLTLNSGENTTSAMFTGKKGTTNADIDGNQVIFYYPTVANLKCEDITDFSDYKLQSAFPKVQNTNDVLMDPNALFGVGTIPSGWPTTTAAVCTTKVTMTNVMGVLDFTLKGSGAVKRLHITDLNESAAKMWGDDDIHVVGGKVTEIITDPSTCASDRTIIAEFNKPIEMSADGVHAYITVLPRTYSNGIQVCVELTNGDYMVKKITGPFEVKGNNVYSLKTLQYASSATEKVGYSDGSTFSYNTFTDSRDSEKYRYITLGGYDIMIDNLRYVPGYGTEGAYEPSNDVNDVEGGFWYPVVLNAAGNAVQFGDAGDVKKVGYLYNTSLAITQEEDTFRDLYDGATDKSKQDTALVKLKGYEGAQGICPKGGWHVPTSDEFSAVCKAAGITIGSTGVNISPLAEKGFTMRDFGYFNISSNTAKSGSPSTYTNKLNATYLILSTPYSYKQMYGAMFNNNNNTISCSFMFILSGVSLRCVRAAD